MLKDSNFKRKGLLSGNFLIFLVMLFVFVLVIIIGYKAFNDLNTDLQLDTSLSNDSKQISDDLHNRYPSTFDGAFAVFMVLAWLAVMVSSFYVDSHPILFAVMLIVLVFILFIATIFSNSYAEFMATDDFTGLETNFPMMHFVTNNLLIVGLVMGMSVVVALFVKSRL